MGIIRNAFWASIGRGHNRRRNGIESRMLDRIPEEGNVVICGGDTCDGSFAAEIKENSFLHYLAQSASEARPTVCIYSDDSLTEGIEELMADPHLGSNICYFGRTHSYIPFDRNVSRSKVEQMMMTLAVNYNKRVGSYDTAVQTTVAMLLNLLGNCFPESYFTYPNLAYIASHLVNRGDSFGGYGFTGEMEFFEWLGRETHQDLSFYVNQLTINWNAAITTFFNFWSELSSEIRGVGRAGLAERSLYSCLHDRKVCVFKLSSNYNKSLIEMILGELALYRDDRSDYTIINSNVDLSRLSDYRLLDVGRTVVIGNTLTSVGMKEYDPPRSSFVSLGVTAEDAGEIFKKMVATGWWTQINAGFGRHSQISFAPTQQAPITADELVNVRDGAAYVITPRGYRRVNMLLV